MPVSTAHDGAASARRAMLHQIADVQISVNDPVLLMAWTSSFSV
jgi:hypothetical protein